VPWFHIIGMVVLTLVAIWLSGFDSGLSDDGQRSDFWRRFLRVLVTFFFVEMIIFMPQMLMGISILLGVTWASCIAELVSRIFRRLIDPGFYDHRPLDPGKSQRYQDLIARLIHQGKRDEAVKLCEELKVSGEVELVTLEHTLEFLGVPQGRSKQEKPLTVAARLRREGKFAEAEKLLRSLLAKKPGDVTAVMMLMRLYGEDLQQLSKAQEVLNALQKQPDVPASHVEFARRSLQEWSHGQTLIPVPALAPAPQSLDELLAQGFVGSAVEQLEAQIKSDPDNFTLQFRLAEVYAIHCKNLQGAEKIVRQITLGRRFTPEQISSAQAKLTEWRRESMQTVKA